jgi:predicted membrane protein
MNRQDRHSWIGIILVAIGGLMIIGNFGIFDFDVSHLIFSWRTIALIIGIIILSNSKNSIAGLVFLVIGLWGYLTYLFPWTFHVAFGDIWPILFIVVGLALLLRKKHPNVHRQKFERHFSQSFNPAADHDGQIDEDMIDEISIFNSVKKIVDTRNFKGGKASSIFGGIHLDFSKADLAPGENHLEISCIFGGCEIFVPKSWKVIVNVTSVFGGIDDKRFMNLEVPSSEGVLIIKGAVIFGGCEIYSV